MIIISLIVIQLFIILKLRELLYCNSFFRVWLPLFIFIIAFPISIASLLSQIKLIRDNIAGLIGFFIAPLGFYLNINQENFLEDKQLDLHGGYVEVHTVDGRNPHYNKRRVIFLKPIEGSVFGYRFTQDVSTYIFDEVGQTNDTVLVIVALKCASKRQVLNYVPTKEEIEIAKKGGYYHNGKLEPYIEGRHRELFFLD